MKPLRYLLAVFVIGALLTSLYVMLRADPDALSQLVEGRCGVQGAPPAPEEPCLKVDPISGYVIIRDRKGSRHYLLLPTQRISGIESMQLLDPSTPNFFWLAWENRDFLTERHGIAEEDILLAVNSRYGRSQNRLHVHISCLSDEVKARLDQVPYPAATWEPLPGGLLSNNYWIRRVDRQQIQQAGPFLLLARDLPGAAGEMGRFGLAVAKGRGEEFLLLATELSLRDLNLASSGELQDYSCGM